MRYLSVLLLGAMAALPASAQQRQSPGGPAPFVKGAIPTRDAEGARDAAALPRYTGAILLEAKVTAFDEANLPNAPLERAGTQRDGRNNALYLPPAPLHLEGRITRLTYVLPEGRSALEVLRGYQQTVRDAGGSVVYECAAEACGGNTRSGATSGGSDTGLIHMLYPAGEVPGRPGHPVGCAVDTARTGQRYTLLALPNNAGHAAVLVWTVGDVSAGSECKAWVGRLVGLVSVAETAAREQRMETVSASALGQGLAREGRVALYAILFDTGRAEVKPESQPQIAELVAFLKGNPSVKALVVGHTDNQGTLDYNLDLSRRRAQAVVAALSAQGIASSRLQAQGVGMAAPLASNAAEEGRARNRRVELVQQ